MTYRLFEIAEHFVVLSRGSLLFKVRFKPRSVTHIVDNSGESLTEFLLALF
jgi:hypothetical protein